MAVRQVFLLSSEVAYLEILVLRYHDSQDFEDVFGDGVVIDADQGGRFGVDLETFVEAECGADRVRT